MSPEQLLCSGLQKHIWGVVYYTGIGSVIGHLLDTVHSVASDI